jgi:hypothetical protein
MANLQEANNAFNDILNAVWAENNKFKDCLCKYGCGIVFEPYDLSCGHVFCRSCIKSHFEKSHKCPTCDESIRNIPHFNRTLNSLLFEICQSDVEDLDCQEWMKQYTKYNEKNEKSMMEMDVAIVKINSFLHKSGKKFLDITSPWGDKSKIQVQKGILRYQGPSRRRYCELMGMTEIAIKEWPMETLQIVVSNLSIPSYILTCNSRALMIDILLAFYRDQLILPNSSEWI